MTLSIRFIIKNLLQVCEHLRNQRLCQVAPSVTRRPPGVARLGIEQHYSDRSRARGLSNITLGGDRYGEFIQHQNCDYNSCACGGAVLASRPDARCGLRRDVLLWSAHDWRLLPPLLCFAAAEA